MGVRQGLRAIHIKRQQPHSFRCIPHLHPTSGQFKITEYRL